VAIPAGDVKNGNLSFLVRTAAPTTPIVGAPGCPNGNWTESIDDLAFTNATITIQQGTAPNFVLVLTVVCMITPPTVDGAVPAQNVTCTQS
jgi:hypothetical protein